MPAVTPTWATDAGVTLEPTLSERQAGFAASDKPPARWQNDYQRKVFQIVDNAMAAQRKTWAVSLDDTNLIFDVDALGWHNGYYYLILESGSERVYRSVDMRRWSFVAATSVAGTNCNTLASDGSRLVYGRGGANSIFSDDDGATAGGLTGEGLDAWIFYLAVAGVWVGTSSLGTIISSDGMTFAVTSGVVGVAASTHFQAAEDATASIILVGLNGGVFSTDGGTTFATTTNGAALDQYYYSEVLGNFIGWTFNSPDTELYDMSGTAGTWSVSLFATIPDFNVDGMFDMNGAIYAYGMSSELDGPDVADMFMTLDVGVTWERVHTFGDDAEGGNFLDHLNPAKPVTGHQPGLNGGFVGMMQTNRYAVTPQFPGILTADPLT